MRNGSAKVSECEAPLLSVSGATTQTSSVRSVAIFSSTSSPGASMPSSLVNKMRIGEPNHRSVRRGFGSTVLIEDVPGNGDHFHLRRSPYGCGSIARLRDGGRGLRAGSRYRRSATGEGQGV